MSRFNIDWPPKDDRLRAMYLAGATKPEIAEVFGVSSGAVAGRILKLGLSRKA